MTESSPMVSTEPPASDSSEPDARAVAESALSGPRQILMFFDGTNNTLTAGVRDTNVLKFYEHKRAEADQHRQLLYYDPGVGGPDQLPGAGWVDRRLRELERLAGMAYGRGVFENISEAYLFLMRNWRLGDQIWLFGFSRGAFTARAVSGMVNLFGVIRPEHESLLHTLMRVYFAEHEEGVEGPREAVAKQIMNGFASVEGRAAWVHFVGVWDTVESVGLRGLRVAITSTPTITCKRIAHVRHALSLDERRWSFKPRLYEQANFGGPQDVRSLHQLWFRGVHSDVGGGYPEGESALSNEAFQWMANEAQSCRLRGPLPPAVESQVKLHDEVHAMPWWGVAGLAARDPSALLENKHTPQAHPSVARLSSALPSVWRGQTDERVRSASLFAWLGLVLLWWLQSFALTDKWWDGGGSLLSPFHLAAIQWNGLWRPLGFAVHEGAVGSRHLGWALALDTLWIGCYGYLLGRFLGGAFWRLFPSGTPTQRASPWQWLGRALTVLVLADLTENLLSLIVSLYLGLGAFCGGWGLLIGVFSTLKIAGLAGCLLLLLLGGLRRR